MNALSVTVVVALAITSCYAGIVGQGVIISGPSGIVTGAGPIGPHGLGLGGHGGVGVGLANGALGVGLAHGGLGVGLAHGGIGLAHGGVIAVPPVYSHGIGGYGVGLGHGAILTNGGGHVSYNGHGVVVKGPQTVPAVIVGPSGKIVADGLYGVPAYGHY